VDLLVAAPHKLVLGLKGVYGLGGADGTGSFAAFRMTAKTYNGKNKQHKNKQHKNKQQQEQATAKQTTANKNDL
jgi:hypothetical protein